jgi:methionyl aminopeptidase
MSIESYADLVGMRAIGRIVALTLDALERATRDGVTTGALDAEARRIAMAHGATSAPAEVYGFPGCVLISVNDEVVHGVPGPRRLRRGDLVKLDVTLQKDGYVADAARTVIVGEGSLAATRLRDCARAALAEALSVARAGIKVNRIGRVVERTVRAHGFAIVPGLEGHGVGRTIHEPPSVPNHYVATQQDVLADGLVLTIEPIISARQAELRQDADGWTLRTHNGSLAAHEEHTLLITTTGVEILTQVAAA